jgi:hypothetical protein
VGDNPFMALASGVQASLERRGRLVRDEAAALEAAGRLAGLGPS